MKVSTSQSPLRCSEPVKVAVRKIPVESYADALRYHVARQQAWFPAYVQAVQLTCALIPRPCLTFRPISTRTTKKSAHVSGPDFRMSSSSAAGRDRASKKPSDQQLDSRPALAGRFAELSMCHA